MMIRMRYVRRASAPDDGSKPGKSNHEHVEYSAKHEDLNGAGTLLKASESHTENAISRTEKDPRDKARSQQITRHTPKSQNRKQSDKTKKSHGG